VRKESCGGAGRNHLS